MSVRIPKPRAEAHTVATAAQLIGIPSWILDFALSTLIAAFRAALVNTSVAKGLRKAALKIFGLICQLYAGDPEFSCDLSILREARKKKATD